MRNVQDDTISSSRLSVSAICPFLVKSKAGWRHPEWLIPLKSPLDPETISARTVLMETTKRFEKAFGVEQQKSNRKHCNS
jgi:hypothetical protein